MREEHFSLEDPRIQRAVEELKGLIHNRYPSATFEVFEGEDPEGVYLRTTVDIEDRDEVIDTVIDRSLEIQIDEGLPVYVIVVQPLERVLKEMESQKRRPRPSIDWGAAISSEQP